MVNLGRRAKRIADSKRLVQQRGLRPSPFRSEGYNHILLDPWWFERGPEYMEALREARPLRRSQLLEPPHMERPDPRHAARVIEVHEPDGLQEALDSALFVDAPHGTVILLRGEAFRGAQARSSDAAGREPVYQWDADPRKAVHIVGEVRDGKHPRVDGIVNRIQRGDLELWLHDIDLAVPPGGRDALATPSLDRYGAIRCRGVNWVRHPEFAGVAGNAELAGKWGIRLAGGSFLHLQGCNFRVVYQEHDAYTDNSAGLIYDRVHFGPTGRTGCQETSRRESSPEPAEYLGYYLGDSTIDGTHYGNGYPVTIWGFPGDVRIRALTIASDPALTEKYGPTKGAIFLGVPDNYGGAYLTPDGFGFGDVRIEDLDARALLHSSSFMVLDGMRSLHLGSHIEVPQSPGPKVVELRARGTGLYRHGPVRWGWQPLAHAYQVHDYDGPGWEDKGHRVLNKADLAAMGEAGFETAPPEVKESLDAD